MKNSYSILMSIYINDTLLNVKSSVDSILSQTIISNDIVVVYDGPVSDDVLRYLEKFKNNFTFVQLEKNSGLGAALNVGLSHCKNNWVLRMDADDICSIKRAEFLLKFINKKKSESLGAVGSYIKEINCDTNETAIIKYPENYNSNQKVNYFRDPIGHASALLNKDAVLSVGGYKTCLFFEDTYLWLRLLSRGYSLATVPELLYTAKVDGNFYKRRSGVKYLKIEIKNFFSFYKEGLITTRSFLINVFLRPIIRLLPIRILRFTYKNFLRSIEKGKENEHEKKMG